MTEFARVGHLKLRRYDEAEYKLLYKPDPYATYDPKYIVGPESYKILS